MSSIPIIACAADAMKHGGSMDLNWINDFLPAFRCPDTHQNLRWATAEELARHGRAGEDKALITVDGSRLFEIDRGIPILLPKAAP